MQLMTDSAFVRAIGPRPHWSIVREAAPEREEVKSLGHFPQFHSNAAYTGTEFNSPQRKCNMQTVSFEQQRNIHKYHY
jgi:hypothetical protein